MTIDEHWMGFAIEEAKKAKQAGDLPFGAVVVCDGEIVGSGYAQDHITPDVSAHAELHAVQRACAELKRTDLSDCVIYCSNEPCVMCAGAIFQASIPRVVIGASRDDIALRPREIRIDQLATDSRHKPAIIKGVLKDKVLELFKGVNFV